jgi:GH15 family glucan-1,4-alpha-glucosidase
MNSRIQQIIETTKTVIQDCSLENGGIVAANSSKKYFPATAKNYFYVWPRDAAFACIAADMLGLASIQENFFDWCMDHAEGFKTDGLFYEKYYPNGLKALPRFQPDQTGAVLFAIWHHLNWTQANNRTSRFDDIMMMAANGICSVWEKDHFTRNTNDLWEERTCFPDLHENFSYSLASCIKGLYCAHEVNPNSRWLQVAQEMKARLDQHHMDFFVRSYGDLPDNRIDASVLGLVYPFEIYEPDDDRIISTIHEIEDKLSVNGGIHRYEHDEYDGWMLEGEHRKKGAGAWPLLNLWLSIYFQRAGNAEKANYYYNWVLERIGEGDFIPEQIFENDIQVSVSPLLWSHSMFAIASKELNYT